MKRRYSWNKEERIERAILAAISQGSTKRQAADLAGIHRSTLFRWLERKSEFAAEFAKAWHAGAKKRSFRLWLAHPFRGKRPPTSKRTRDFPRFGKPRLKR
jgi:hypothetical protein